MNFNGRWFVGFGVFLILCGVAGFLSNPAGAKTALLSGGTFGALSVLWGVLLLRGMSWAKWAGLVMTAFLTLVFAWRATTGWMAYLAGEPKLFAASLISLMFTGAVVTLVVVARRKS